MSKFESMSDDYLRKTYVPDVYQKNIYAIDYQLLKTAGIKVISFDIDDTVAALEDWKPPKAAVTLFENLKLMGFGIYLLSIQNLIPVRNVSETVSVWIIFLMPINHALQAWKKCRTDICPEVMWHRS